MSDRVVPPRADELGLSRRHLRCRPSAPRGPVAALRRLFALAAVLSSAACLSFHDRPPEAWQVPASTGSGACASIAGDYDGRGESVRGTKDPYLLLELRRTGAAMRWDSGANDTLRLDTIERVALSAQDDTTIRVVGWQGDRPLLSGRLDPGSDGVSCEGGWLRIRSTRWERARIETVVSLRREGDFLFVKVEEELVTITLPPVSLSFATWSRYRVRNTSFQ